MVPVLKPSPVKNKISPFEDTIFGYTVIIWIEFDTRNLFEKVVKSNPLLFEIFSLYEPAGSVLKNHMISCGETNRIVYEL